MAAESIPKEKKDELFSYFEQNTSDGKKFTVEAISASVGVSVPTVIKYKKEWERKQKEQTDLKNAAIQPDPLEVFEQQIRNVPGAVESKIDYVMSTVRANPKLLENPTDVTALLTEVLGLRSFYVQMVLRTIFPNQPSQSNPYGPQQPQMYGQPQNPYAPPQQGQYPYPAPYGPYAPPSGPYPPPYWQYPQPPQQAPAAPAGITKDDLRSILLELQQSHRGNDDDRAYEEIEEPIIINGEIQRDSSGDVIMRTIRRPAQTHATPVPTPAPTPPREDPIDYLIKLKTAGFPIFPEAKVAAPSIDPELRNSLDKIREENANTKTLLEMERVRREERERSQVELDKEREARRSIELASARTPTGVTGADAVILEGLKETKDVVKEAQKNNQERLDRVEKLAMIMLQPGGTQTKPLPRTDEELTRLALATEQMNQNENTAQATAAAAFQARLIEQQEPEPELPHTGREPQRATPREPEEETGHEEPTQ